MDIGKVDENLVIRKADENGIVWYDASEKVFELHGVYYEEERKTYRRLPLALPGKTMLGDESPLMYHTSGGRLRFYTDADGIFVRAKIWYRSAFSHMPASGAASFSLYADYADGTSEFCGILLADYINDDLSAAATIGSRILKKNPVGYTLYFPLYSGVVGLTVGVREGSTISPTSAKYADRLPLLFYGSSITQGGCVSQPGNCYPAIIARETNMDYINIGLSGGCKGEPAMRDFLATIDASVFVLDYDYNAPTPEHLEATHFFVYETYRKAHPTTPIIMVTRPNPDWGEVNAERREIIRASYDRALGAGDKAVAYIDGSHLMDGPGSGDCTVDGCHPNDLGFRRMADGIGAVVRKFL